MPDRVEVQDLTCPAGTTADAPLEVVLLNVVACQVVQVTVVIPPGHAGLTGLALGYGHNAVLPRSTGAYISGDGEVIRYAMDDYPAGPQWQAFLCNLDTIDHRWEVRFEVDDVRDHSPPIEPFAIQPEDIHAAGLDFATLVA